MSLLRRIENAQWALNPAAADVAEAEPAVWVRWFPGDVPVGQGTLIPPLQRRAGFRISIGVIAEAGAAEVPLSHTRTVG